MEEARRHGLALQQAHGAAVAVGQNRLRCALSERFQAGGDGLQRLVPTDALELALALLADAAQRMQQTVDVVGALGVACYLGTQHASRGDRKSTRLNSSHLGISYA